MTGINANLIKRCIASDEKALYILYSECYSLMKGIALRYVYDQNDISDVVNRGFVKIVRGLKSYDVNQEFSPWAATVMIHESLDYVRKIMRQQPKQLQLKKDLMHQASTSFEWNAADRQFDAEHLLKALNQLPPKTRTVFNLFAIDGYSHDEISKKLKISEGTSKWHVSNAREKLKKMLASKMTKIHSE
ncbi:MAG: RNA polymerase sigma factor (sigma-70 family) [Saprospiraceae bacterium]|jgi:RNA polymerase sigma factor (sigma-70 family)